MGQSGQWRFCAICVNRENGKGCGCEDLVDDLRHRHSFVRQNVCVFALQGTDKRNISEMNAPGYVCQTMTPSESR